MELIKNMKKTAEPVFYGKNGLISNPAGFVFWSFCLGATTLIFGNVIVGAFEKTLNGGDD